MPRSVPIHSHFLDDGLGTAGSGSDCRARTSGAPATLRPILSCEPTIPYMTGARVRNAMPMPQIDRWLDPANLWLEPAE
ncbi:hypothetical protein D5S18_05295 [Nocardia panacis]|uniref:Uncharacterized protein n=1 Tax=Nocardia panacis TaxID=2340916 RepID=A0A3A4KTG4_9NOCA|nr:hypothetical protein D5S18_05295 [Nocardia panacis]